MARREELPEEENEFIEKDANKATKFQSPVPILRQLRNLIFGLKIPDMYTRLTFYMNVVLWTTFILWDVLSYFAMTSTELFVEQKGIPIEQIISERGAALGFGEGDFLARLTTYHSIGIICWLVFFFGLILMYRKNKRYIYFCLGALIFYFGMCIFYIGFSYFLEDTTTYDKIALLIMIASIIFHSYLMGNSHAGYRAGFFGEAIAEDE